MNGGLVLNVVVMSDDGRSVWQLFSDTGAENRLAELVAETTVGQAYHPWFMCGNGDILATRRDPATDMWVVVRLQIDFEVSSAD